MSTVVEKIFFGFVIILFEIPSIIHMRQPGPLPPLAGSVPRRGWRGRSVKRCGWHFAFI
jgi:hypothetical protein